MRLMASLNNKTELWLHELWLYTVYSLHDELKMVDFLQAIFHQHV